MAISDSDFAMLEKHVEMLVDTVHYQRKQLIQMDKHVRELNDKLKKYSAAIEKFLEIADTNTIKRWIK